MISKLLNIVSYHIMLTHVRDVPGSQPGRSIGPRSPSPHNLSDLVWSGPLEAHLTLGFLVGTSSGLC